MYLTNFHIKEHTLCQFARLGKKQTNLFPIFCPTAVKKLNKFVYCNDSSDFESVDTCLRKFNFVFRF